MSKYNYYEAVHDDIVTAIFDNYSNEQIVTNLRNDEEIYKGWMCFGILFKSMAYQPQRKCVGRFKYVYSKTLSRRCS